MSFQPNESFITILQQNGLSKNEAICVLEMTNNDLDKAFEIIIQNSTSNPPKDPLQQAIEESKKTGGVAGSSTNPIDVGGISKEEQELNAVLAESYKDAYKGGVDSTNMAMIQYENPNFRKRESKDVSVGLKNIGNTCYLNSMIQTYFMIPEVRRTVLNFPYGRPISDDNPRKNQIKFTKELQRLFVYLIYSNQKWVDPSQLLKTLTDEQGKPVNVGNQEDASEFNGLFLTTIHNAFQAVTSEKDKENNIDLIKQMFFGTFQENFSIFSPDKKQIKKTTKTEIDFNSLLLTVPEFSKVKSQFQMETDLYDLIDDSLVDEMDYKDEGEATSAEKIKWFKVLPQVIIFQQNRVRYDAEKKTNTKINTPVQFEKEIFLDRYLEENKSDTENRRVIVKKLKVELKGVKEELDSYLHYKGADHGLHEALDTVIDDLINKKEKESSENKTTFEKMIQVLKERHRNVQFQIKELREKIDELEKKIKTFYSDLNKTSYFLMSVWIHRGSPSTGHYWAFTRNFQKEKEKKWIKFNDIRVSEEDEENVFKESIGGMGDTSAYFLFYVEKGMVDRFDLKKSSSDINFKETIPQILLDEVEEDNKKFEKELEEFSKKSGGDKFETFTKKYQETIKKTESDYKEQKDSPLSFYHHLLILDKSELMFAQIFFDTYKQVFERDLQQDIGNEIFEKIRTNIGEAIVSKAIQLALGDLPEVKVLKFEYEDFQISNFLFALGLQYTLDKKYEDGIKFLYSAHERHKGVNSQTLKKTKHIKGALLVCIKLFLDDLVSTCTPDNIQTVVNGLKLIIPVSRNILKLDHPMYLGIKSSYGTLVKTSKRPELYGLAASFSPDKPIEIPFKLETVDLSVRSLDILGRIPKMWNDLKHTDVFETIWSSYI